MPEPETPAVQPAAPQPGGRDYLHAEGEQQLFEQAQRALALAEQAETEFLGPQQVEWLARLDAEYDRMRGVLAWSLDDSKGQPEQGYDRLEAGLRLASALQPFWERRGHLTEGREWLDTLLQKAERSASEGRGADDRVFAKAVKATARQAYKQHDLPEARRLYEKSLGYYTQLGDPAGKASALVGLGHVARAYHDLTEAGARYSEALVLRRELGDKWGLASTISVLGKVALGSGKLDDAAALMDESIALDRELGDTEGLALDLEAAGQIRFLQGRFSEALAHTESALALYRELGEEGNISEALDTLGWFAILEGDYARATLLLEEALSFARELEGDDAVAAWPLCRLGIVAARLGDTHGARKSLAESLNLFLKTDPRAVAGIGMCLLGFAELAGAQHQPEAMARLAGAADAIDELCDTVSRAFAHSELARNKDASRSLLNREVFAAAWEEGRNMTMEAAIAYALKETTPAASS